MNFLIIVLFLCFQLAMNKISKYLGYDLDKKYYLGSSVVNVLSTQYVLNHYGFNSCIFIIFITTTILITSCCIDFKYKILPNKYNIAVACLGIINLMINLRSDFMPYLISSISLFLLFMFLALITGGSIGMGDVKLMSALGLFIHYTLIPKLLVYAFMSGGIVSILLLVTKIKNKKDKIAFGPYLVLAGMVVILL